MLKRNSNRILGFCAALLLVIALASAAPEERIVAIGDVHGDLTDFQSILRQAGLTNDKGNWIGGATVLVQTGDVVDRGPKSRECLDLLMSLERQARKQKGKVIALVGNHEVMAMMGDLRYVSPEDYRGFATERSEKVREDAYQDYLEFVAHGQPGGDVAPGNPTARERWMLEHPLGFIERRDAFSPQGVYGRWIREHDAVAEIGGVVYLHGGLNPAVAYGSVQELNQEIHAELAAFDSLWQSLSKKKIIWKYMRIEEALRQAESQRKALQADVKAPADLKNDLDKFLSFPNWLINSPDSPVWYRGLAEEPEVSLGSGVEEMLGRLKAGYMVVGHTVQSNFQINQRFGNRVMLIDTGMLGPVFGGKASALEMRGGRFTAYYANGKPQLLPPVTAGAISSEGSRGNSGGPRP